jgi:hypothetical protein
MQEVKSLAEALDSNSDVWVIECASQSRWPRFLDWQCHLLVTSNRKRVRQTWSEELSTIAIENEFELFKPKSNPDLLVKSDRYLPVPYCFFVNFEQVHFSEIKPEESLTRVLQMSNQLGIKKIRFFGFDSTKRHNVFSGTQHELQWVPEVLCPKFEMVENYHGV